MQCNASSVVFVAMEKCSNNSPSSSDPFRVAAGTRSSAQQMGRLQVSVVMSHYKSPCVDQIRAELIPAGGEILWSEIHKLINFIWSEKELPDSARGLLLYQLTRTAI
jgi:hypothetical protein